jgi:hypothetical protein
MYIKIIDVNSNNVYFEKISLEKFYEKYNYENKKKEFYVQSINNKSVKWMKIENICKNENCELLNIHTKSGRTVKTINNNYEIGIKLQAIKKSNNIDDKLLKTNNLNDLDGYKYAKYLFENNMIEFIPENVFIQNYDYKNGFQAYFFKINNNITSKHYEFIKDFSYLLTFLNRFSNISYNNKTNEYILTKDYSNYILSSNYDKNLEYNENIDDEIINIENIKDDYYELIIENSNNYLSDNCIFIYK